MTRITLQAENLLSTLPDLLPASHPLRSQQEAIAALLHTIQTTIGFNLVAVDDVSSASHIGSDSLPTGWDARAPDFTFKYRHSNTSTAILNLKVLKLGNRTLIHGSKDQTDDDASFEFLTSTYVSPSYFPSSIDSEPLVHAFVSTQRLEEFVTEYLNRILKLLTPEISLDPQPSHSETESGAQQTEGPRRSPPPDNPLRPTIPPFLDPVSRLREPAGYRAGENPYEIGRQDLDPIPNTNPFAPTPLFGGALPGGGMYVGPGHPMFAGRGSRGRGQPGPWGGDGYLPPFGAPPGARFDPVGPFGRGGFPGVGRGRGSRPGAFGGDPDNDEFFPPGPGGPGAFGGNHSPFGGPGNMYM